MQLHRARDDIEATGARLAVVGQGTPAHAGDFRRAQGVDLPLLVDSKREAYRAAGARIATLGELVGPKQALKAVGRFADTRRLQGRVLGDPAQLGGVLVVAPDGSIPWAHLSQDASDNPPVGDVIAAARAATASRGA